MPGILAKKVSGFRSRPKRLKDKDREVKNEAGQGPKIMGKKGDVIPCPPLSAWGLGLLFFLLLEIKRLNSDNF